jgi:thiamine biosynthesis lipoprotein
MPGGAPTAPPGSFVRQSLSGQTMGTIWSIDCFTPPDTTEEFIRQPVERELEKINAQMSHWREDSYLSRFNRAAAGTWLTLPEEFFSVLQFALHVARKSGGAFDPALGASVNAWGFGPSGSVEPTAPPRTGHRQNIHLNPDTREARQPGGAILDLSAIAKGFAVDHIVRLLEKLGLESFLVEIGGELSARGIKPDQQPWWIAVEPPGEEFPDEIIVALHNRSIATSGDYRRWFVKDGVRYPHTIDPKTSAPSRHPIASVSVIHATAMAADAYSTALNVLGPDKGMALADRLELPAVFILRTADSFVIRHSQSFEKMLSG